MINAYLEARPSMMYCPFTLYGMNATGLNVALYDGLMLRKKNTHTHKKGNGNLFLIQVHLPILFQPIQSNKIINSTMQFSSLRSNQIKYNLVWPCSSVVLPTLGGSTITSQIIPPKTKYIEFNVKMLHYQSYRKIIIIKNRIRRYKPNKLSLGQEYLIITCV